MTNSTSLKLYLHQKDGQCFQVPMRCTVAEALATVRELFDDGPYTKAELYRGKRLVETMRNSAMRAASASRQESVDLRLEL